MDAHISVIPSAALVFLAAAVFAPPLFKRFGLGTIVGYLAAGILVGPSALGVFNDPGQVMHFAELGVVLLLFVIGLELEPSRLFAMRRDIIGLGLGQLAAATALIAGVGWLSGMRLSGAAVAGFAFALSSTAVAIQLLHERGHLTRPYGQRTFAILLAQDLAIVPALALIPALGTSSGLAAGWTTIALKGAAAVAGVAIIVLAGRYLIDPVLRLVARSGARETMGAAALLLVFGAAVVAEVGGLSMALGAFLAGLLLSESSYRHELEANIEPFRGILLALFFMGVGMSLDLAGTAADAPLLLLGLVSLLTLKMIAGILVIRASNSSWPDAVRAAALLAPASEFAFVLFPLAARHGLMSADTANALAAIGALSMMLGPPLASLVESLLRRRRSVQAEPQEIETFEEAKGTALVLGFGRFSHITTQLLLAQNVETTLIDNNVDHIRAAAKFGFKVYYGDATRLDVLRAARADQARVILVCVDDPPASLKIVDLVQKNFPLARLLVRAYDRAHAIELMKRGVEQPVRELFESSLAFGRLALEALGVDPDTAYATEAEMRRLDLDRLEQQRAKQVDIGPDLRRQKVVRPEPLVEPKHAVEPLNAIAATVVASESPTSKPEAAAQ